MVYKNIKSVVESSYNHTQTETPYAFEIDATVANLKTIDNEVVQQALSLFEPYPEAYEKLSLGSHSLDGKAEINVDVYAMAYGITDRISVYMGVPIYDATVSVNYKRSSNSSNAEVAEILQNQYGDDWAQTLGNVVENFYSIDENILQSALVNTLGYDELGNWQGQGLGDIEFGVMYNFLRAEKYGLMATFGGVSPTGYVDDPDLLQDISFGDGQWDAFFEFGGGYRLHDKIILNSWARYTHQFASEKYLRAPYSNEVSITDQQGDFEEKLGDKINAGIYTELWINDWFKLEPHYLYSYTGEAKYDSDNAVANRILSENTESSSKSFKLLAEVNTVNLYLKQKFFLPGKIQASYQTMLEGQNTPKVDLIELHFQMFF